MSLESRPMYTYKTLPFPLTLPGQTRLMPEAAARELERLINQEAQGGWEYWRMETLEVQEGPSVGGFFRAFFGGLIRPIRYSVLVFRRPS
ncbi:hypothetical protein [Deinococcus sp.]|uniref:hypothetical protein n=1 Tax=Deinococcus sp. TaxID=47478 RepID=UPI003B58E4C4